MDWNPDTPLARYAEPSKVHTALCEYAALGPGRSLAQLEAAYRARPRVGPEKPPTRQLSQLKVWSAEFHWQERVAAYDAQQAQAQLAAREAERRRRAAQFNETVWAAAEAGIARVRELLEQTAIETTVTEEVTADEDGRRMKVVTRREAPKGTLRDVAALLKAVTDAGRLVAGEPTSHERIDLRVPSPEELAQMSEAELAALEAEITAHLKP